MDELPFGFTIPIRCSRCGHRFVRGIEELSLGYFPCSKCGDPISPFDPEILATLRAAKEQVEALLKAFDRSN